VLGTEHFFINKDHQMSKLFKILFSSLTIYVIVLFCGAYLTLQYESYDINSNIKNFYDALWWSLNATSIGDSNVYPITIEGRIVGVFLILIGYGLFTINIATISSILNNFVTQKNIFLKKPMKEIEKVKNKFRNKNKKN
jgi:voltage-gated potassium channel